MKELAEKGIVIESFEEIPGVYFFDKAHEYAMKGTRAFYDGLIYLQSLSSLLPALVLDPQA